jgi:CspA family cold shock protein
MGRGRDFRGGGKGRRPYDENAIVPAEAGDRHDFPPLARMASPTEGAAVDATVKWFNPDKGFGFAELADGSGDAFLHIKAVQALGQDTVAVGAKLSVLVGDGQKGRQITKVLAVIDSGGASVPARSAPPSDRPTRTGSVPDPSTAVEMLGTVKWFTPEKGMGFVEVDSGGRDVFVHISVVERARLTTLTEGQRVAMQVVETPKGRQALSINPAD